MAKYQVNTLQGVFVYDAEDEDQARRLGKDGGRIVTSVEQIDESDAGEFVEDADMRGASFDSTHPHAAVHESSDDPLNADETVNADATPVEQLAEASDADFGDEEIVVIPRSGYDRLVGLARAGGATDLPKATTIDRHDIEGPHEPYAVTEATDDPGMPAPRDDDQATRFAEQGGQSFEPTHPAVGEDDRS